MQCYFNIKSSGKTSEVLSTSLIYSISYHKVASVLLGVPLLYLILILFVPKGLQ